MITLTDQLILVMACWDSTRVTILLILIQYY